MSFQYCHDKKCATRTEKKAMKQFLESLQYTLPCNECREHYGRYLEFNPPKLDNRRGLFKWIVDLHNYVNNETNMKIERQYGYRPANLMKRMYSYKEVEEMYKAYYKQ
jgi:hypothetical protein